MQHSLIITVALPLSEPQRARLQGTAPGAEFRFCPPDEVLETQVRDADILIGKIPPAICQKARNVKWYQANAAGPDAYLKPGVFAPEVIVTSAVGAYGLAVGEHCFAMTLALLKRLPGYRDAQHAHVWRSQGQVRTLRSARVLVLGLGDIGETYGRLCHGCGSHVTGLRRHPGDTPDYLDALLPIERLDTLLPEADIVALFLPESESTIGLLNKERIDMMKPGALVINGGRGTVLDTAALCAALHIGALGGAGLDVTDPEPLPPQHPLWDEPNALITPHVAGGFHLPETVERIVDIAAENLRRYQSSEPLINRMDRTPNNKTK